MQVAYALAKVMPLDTPIEPGDFVQTTLEPGVFEVSRVLNHSFVMLATTMRVSRKINGKYKTKTEHVETHTPRSSITEIRRPVK